MDSSVFKRKLMMIGGASFIAGAMFSPNLTEAGSYLDGQARGIGASIGKTLQETFTSLFDRHFTGLQGAVEQVEKAVESVKGEVIDAKNEVNKVEKAIEKQFAEKMEFEKGLLHHFLGTTFERAIKEKDKAGLFKTTHNGIEKFFTNEGAKQNAENLKKGAGVDIPAGIDPAEKQRKVYASVGETFFQKKGGGNPDQYRAETVEVNSRRARLMQDTTKSSLAAAIHQQDDLGSDEFEGTVSFYVDCMKEAVSKKDLAHIHNTLLLEMIKELRQQRQLMAYMVQLQAAEHMQRFGTLENTETCIPNPQPKAKAPDRRSIADVFDEVDSEYQKRKGFGR